MFRKAGCLPALVASDLSWSPAPNSIAMDSRQTDVMDSGSPQHHSTHAPRPRRWRRAVVSGSLLLSMLATGTLLLPSLLLQTSASQLLLSLAAGSGISVTSSGASGGWLTPLVFQNVQLRDAAGQLDCSIAELSTSKGLWGFLSGASTTTLLRLQNAVLRIKIGPDGRWPEFGSQDAATSDVLFAVENGHFQLSVPWRQVPLVDLDQLNLTGHVGLNSQQRRTIQFHKSQIFDHTPLSDSHADQNLALVAPVLSQTSNITGSASVWLDAIEMPLDATGSGTPFPIRGRVTFHKLEAMLADPLEHRLPVLLRRPAGLILPDRLRVAQETSVNFEITESGIHHDRMEFQLPQVASDFQIATSGTLRLDETLDLQLEVGLPGTLSNNLLWLRLLSFVVKPPLMLAVTGTIAEPAVGLPDGFRLWNVGGLFSNSGTANTWPSAPGGLINSLREQGAAGARKSLTGSLLNLMQAGGAGSDGETPVEKSPPP